MGRETKTHVKTKSKNNCFCFQGFHSFAVGLNPGVSQNGKGDKTHVRPESKNKHLFLLSRFPFVRGWLEPVGVAKWEVRRETKLM